MDSIHSVVQQIAGTSTLFIKHKRIMHKKILFVFLSMILMYSCKDDELAPIIDYSNLQFGAYIRLVSQGNDTYDLSSSAGGTYEYSVEFVDVEQGGTVTSYDIFVSLDDNSPSNGDASTGEQLLASFGTGDFSTNENGFVSISVSVTLDELLSLLSLSRGDLFARDKFDFRTEISTTEGRTHTFDNSSPAVNGSAFAGFFNHSADIICGIDDSAFVGEYEIEYIDAPTGGLGAAFGDAPGKVELTATSKTQRSFEITYLPDSENLPVTVTFELLCDITEIASVSTGLSCVSGLEATIQQSEDEDGVFNIDDDSELTLIMVEFESDGGCGQDAAPLTIRLTK